MRSFLSLSASTTVTLEPSLPSFKLSLVMPTPSTRSFQQHILGPLLRASASPQSRLRTAVMSFNISCPVSPRTNSTGLAWATLPATTVDMYSTIAYASSQGYPTFVIDRIGVGDTRPLPDPILQEQVNLEEAINHKLVTMLKAGTAVPGKPLLC
jgi:hypothetical protein